MSTPAYEANDHSYPPLPNETSMRPCTFAPVLRTDRLTLTILDPENPDGMEFCIDVFNDPDIVATAGDLGIKTFKQLGAYTRSVSLLPQHTPSNKHPTGPAVWLVRLGQNNPTGQYIGLINFCSRNELMPPDMGWAILPSHQNQGYASEAALRVRDYVLNEFQGGLKNRDPPLRIVSIISNTKNIRSMGVARRLGFVRAGEVSIYNSGGRIAAVFSKPGPGMEVLTPDIEYNIYGPGEAGKRTAEMISSSVPDSDEGAAKAGHTKVAMGAKA